MKVNIIKHHHFYAKGTADVPDERARYLLSIGIAEEIEQEKEEVKPAKEKVEPVHQKEKQELQPGQIPGTRKGKDATIPGNAKKVK